MFSKICSLCSNNFVNRNWLFAMNPVYHPDSGEYYDNKLEFTTETNKADSAQQLKFICPSCCTNGKKEKFEKIKESSVILSEIAPEISANTSHIKNKSKLTVISSPDNFAPKTLDTKNHCFAGEKEKELLACGYHEGLETQAIYPIYTVDHIELLGDEKDKDLISSSLEKATAKSVLAGAGIGLAVGGVGGAILGSVAAAAGKGNQRDVIFKITLNGCDEFLIKADGNAYEYFLLRSQFSDTIPAEFKVHKICNILYKKETPGNLFFAIGYYTIIIIIVIAILFI